MSDSEGDWAGVFTTDNESDDADDTYESESDSLSEMESENIAEDTEDVFQAVVPNAALTYRSGMAFMQVADLRAIINGKEIKCTDLPDIGTSSSVASSMIPINETDTYMDFEGAADGEEDSDDDTPQTVEELANRMQFSSTEEWRPVENKQIQQRNSLRKQMYIRNGCTYSDGRRKSCIRCKYWEPGLMSVENSRDSMPQEAKEFITMLHNNFLKVLNPFNITALCVCYTREWNAYFDRDGRSPGFRMNAAHVEYHFRECLGLPYLKLGDTLFVQGILMDEVVRTGVFIRKNKGGFETSHEQVSGPMARICIASSRAHISSLSHIPVFHRQLVESYSNTSGTPMRISGSSGRSSSRASSSSSRRKKVKPLNGLAN
ncbi:MAG: hypothetical protein JSS82_12495 [Bacteroidetes bacterium]|nr:hypothetical protein [Bacteroidota bacterium]